MNDIDIKNFEFFEMFFSPELLVPIVLVFVVVLVCRAFFKLNCGDDEMEKFIALGGDKLDGAAFEDFVKYRRLWGNSILLAVLFAAIGAYIYFITTL